jgi:hypothetical protein
MKSDLLPCPRRRHHDADAALVRTFRVLALATLCFAVGSVAFADEWAPNLTVTGVWNSNATNANLGSDKISAFQTTADLVATKSFQFGGSDSLHPGLHAAAEWWPQYAQLTTGAVGVSGEWQHKFGVGALAPLLSIAGNGDVVVARETGRRGTSYGVTLAIRKRFNDVTRLTLTEELSRLDARYSVYDRSASLTTLELSRDVTDIARFTVAAFWRDGTVVSYATPPRPDLVGVAAHRLTVDSFDRPLTAYSLNARTLGAKFGIIRALDDSSAVILGYEYRDTDHSPLRYVNHLVSLALVHQF